MGQEHGRTIPLPVVGHQMHLSSIRLSFCAARLLNTPEMTTPQFVIQCAAHIEHSQMKSTLTRFGIRNFKPTLRKAEEKLDNLQTAEGTPLPENTRAELRRDIARLRVVREQIREIELERLRKLEAAPSAKRRSSMR